MTNNLKIEVLVSNIPEDGSIASQFPSQEYVNQQLAKKANLSPEGRLDPSHAPDYTEIPGLYEHIEDTKDEIGLSIADSLQDAKGYTNQQLSTSLQTKADLVNGKIPFDQIPFSANIEEQIQINVENITAVVDQKVAQVVEQVNGVATAANSYTDTKVAENKTYVDTTIGNVIEDVERLGVSKAVTIPTYLTPEAGVAAGTGVAAGAYFNVRSTEDDTMLVEYRNVGGVPTPTGKASPSADAVRNIAKYTALPFVDGKTYGLNERVQLENGDIVKSTVDGNTNNPNSNVMGWFNRKDIETVKLWDFLNSVEINSAASGIKVDLTNKIQTAINSSVGRKLVINRGLYGVSFGGANGLSLDIPSNITIEFEQGAKIEAMPHNATIYQMMRVWDRENVTIIDANLDGRKDLNSATSGEFGMGIDVRGGSNINLIRPITNNCWGDGIYWGLSGTTSTKDGYVLRHKAKGCRRQGFSLVSANGLVIDSPIWEDIAGIEPAAGLDIEPNSNDDDLIGIKIINPVTKNCRIGILIYLGNFAGVKPKNIDIKITNHTDDGSITAFNVGAANTSSGLYSLNGSVTTENPTWKNNKIAALNIVEHDALACDINIVRPTVIDPNRNGGTSITYNSPFAVIRDSGSVKTYPIGNVRIIEPSVELTSGTIPALFFIRDVPNGISGVRDVHFIDPVKIKGTTAKRGFFLGSGSISDKYNQWNFESAGSETLTFASVGPILPPNLSATYTLSSTLLHDGMPDIIFKIKNPASCIIATESGGSFVGLSAGKRLQCVNGKGSYLRLRPLGAGVFLIVERVGSWTEI